MLSAILTERAVAEIDTAALIRNYRLLRARSGRAQVLAVVKANAYGHGLPLAVSALFRAGCCGFAVATLEEAATVRLHAPGAEILILGYTPPEQARSLAALGATQAVFSPSYARELHSAAKAAGCRLRVQIKLDGGMCRLGFPFTEKARDRLLSLFAECPFFLPSGVFLHLPSVAEDPAGTGEVLSRLRALRGELFACGMPLPCHAAASAALLLREDAVLDATRPGLALYGVSPVPSPLPLTPVMHLSAPLVQLHRVPAGTPVGYGGSYRTAGEALIGTLPIGYADGIPRALSGFRVTLSHREERFSVPIVGHICMDQCMLELTGTPAEEGDPVWLLEDIAAAAAYAGTVPYELLSGIGARVPRVEKEGKEQKRTM